MSNSSTYRYQLDKTSKKVRCTSCGHKTAVLYVDTESNEYLPDQVQRCDRENKCGHHYTPRQYFFDSGLSNSGRLYTYKKAEVKEMLVEFIDLDYVKRSMKGFERSNFADYLQTIFGSDVAKRLLLKYFVGRSRNNNGKACVFWQIDEAQNVRYGKIMCYDAKTGKRRKDIPPEKAPVTPVNYLQTFFGCHLLFEYPNKPVAIVESEKTAIIASFFMPQYNWLATGGSSGCKWREYAVYKVLQGKEVVLFPDYGYFSCPQSKPKQEWKTCYQEWCERADHISEKINCKITVNRLLENVLTEDRRIKGEDLADFLIKPDSHTGIALTDEGYPAIWDYKKVG